MVDSELYDPSNDSQVACFEFCFMKLIQEEVDLAKLHWNILYSD